MRPISRRQIGRDCVTAAASFAYLGDDTVGFSRATAVMDENCAPAAASARALARPMPREAPVTRAVLPERLGMSVCFAI